MSRGLGDVYKRQSLCADQGFRALLHPSGKYLFFMLFSFHLNYLLALIRAFFFLVLFFVML